jgi:hypothetical protein
MALAEFLQGLSPLDGVDFFAFVVIVFLPLSLVLNIIAISISALLVLGLMCEMALKNNRKAS